MIENEFIAELMELDFWVPWRLEFEPPMSKPTKRPYLPSGWPANITDERAWQPYQIVKALPMTCIEPCAPTTPIAQTGFSGFGFVFSYKNGYTGIDIDPPANGPTPDQQEIYKRFASYTEYSPSGKGIHIIVKGKVPAGKRRDGVEVYSEGRYFTMTGNVLNPMPIAERQGLLDELFKDMGGKASDGIIAELHTEIYTDEQILNMAYNAVNGDKFQQLWAGNWQGMYPSQSEADMALGDMLAFYSKHRQQFYRLFRQSALGARDKAQRDGYLDYIFNKSFDNQVPLISQASIDAVRATIEGATVNRSEPGSSTTIAAAPATHNAASGHMPRLGDTVNGKSALPGLLGRLSNYIYNSASRQVRLYADVGAIAILTGVTARAFNVSGTGLNQYFLMLGGTGSGKDAVNAAWNTLSYEIAKTTPVINEFKGAAELVSPQGTAKSFLEKKSQLMIVGEIGKKMIDMHGQFANSNLKGINRLLLQFYSLSGAGQFSPAMAYSDRGNNIAEIPSPCLTMLGESVPDTIYNNFDESLISDGLLPRFLIWEYEGLRPLDNENRITQPPVDLVDDFATLISHCAANNNANSPTNVPMTQEAYQLFKRFDAYTTGLINATKSNGIAELWNRAHLKALKLAAVGAIALSVDNRSPVVIDDKLALWATTIVEQATRALTSKFEQGEIGVAEDSDAKRIETLSKVIKRYLTEPLITSYVQNMKNVDLMHQQAIIPESYIQKQVVSGAGFKGQYATAKIKSTLQTLIDWDLIGEMPPMQMKEKFNGSKAKAFFISNPEYFLNLKL